MGMALQAAMELQLLEATHDPRNIQKPTLGNHNRFGVGYLQHLNFLSIKLLFHLN